MSRNFSNKLSRNLFCIVMTLFGQKSAEILIHTFSKPPSSSLSKYRIFTSAGPKPMIFSSLTQNCMLLGLPSACFTSQEPKFDLFQIEGRVITFCNHLQRKSKDFFCCERCTDLGSLIGIFDCEYSTDHSVGIQQFSCHSILM